MMPQMSRMTMMVPTGSAAVDCARPRTSVAGPTARLAAQLAIETACSLDNSRDVQKAAGSIDATQGCHMHAASLSVQAIR